LIKTDTLKAAFAFDHQNARRAQGDSLVLVAGPGVADVAWLHAPNFFVVSLAELHIDFAVKNDKNLFAIVYVPDVGFIGPV
jgi:hypothetical protein